MNRISFLIGLFVVPALLLWLGHGFRSLKPRSRALFWGVLGGWVAGVFAATAALLTDPVLWSGGTREILIFHGMLLGALLGAARWFLPGRRVD